MLPGTNRKTTDIVIERDGTIAVRLPIDMPPEQVDMVVRSKRMWIYRNLAEWRDLNATAVVREWVKGETFLYLGSAYRLSLISGQVEKLKLKDGRFCLNREIIDAGGVDAAKKTFENFYIEKGTGRLNERIDRYSPKIGVKPTQCVVKELGYRWASCSPSNGLSFHWKCMMAPVKIIDYIVVHELCHINQRDHTNVFWNEVDKVMPDYLERKEWLKRYGAGLSL